MLGGGIGIPTVGLLIAALSAQSIVLYNGFSLAIPSAIAWQYRWSPIRLVECDNGLARPRLNNRNYSSPRHYGTFMQIRQTRVQFPASVTNPVVRELFRDGAFFTGATMTMVAVITIGAVHRFRCAVDLCPCLFRRTGLDQKKLLVALHAVGLLSDSLNLLVSDINRIEHLIAIVPLGKPYVTAIQPFPSHVSTPLGPCNNRWRWRPQS